MPDYRSPGVYVEEVPASVRPIAGVGTSTAGFIGIVPDTVVVPRPNPHHNPTQAESAVTEIEASVENLLGKTLAQDIGLTTQVTLPAGTVLNENQAAMSRRQVDRWLSPTSRRWAGPCWASAWPRMSPTAWAT